MSSWPVSRVVAAPLTHVLLQPVASVVNQPVASIVNQPVASVVNPTPTVCHSSTTADDVITDQWRRSLVIDTSDPYIPVVSGITVICSTLHTYAPCGAGAPLFSPFPFTSSSFPPFYFSLSFIGFTYFLLLSIPSLSTRIVPLRFHAGGRRRRRNLGLVCVLFCTLCYLYSLVKMYCDALFYLVFCVFLQCFDTVGWVI